MTKFYTKLFVFLFVVASTSVCFADNYEDALAYIRKAKSSKQQEQQYDMLNKARELLEDEYAFRPTDLNVLLALSETFQLMEDRAEAKLYVLRAYNMDPSDPVRQKAMGDFYYSFQEYSTAVEYYKAALASGLLRDYTTNIRIAKCFEKLGDTQSAELYYKISLHLNDQSREAMNKLNEYESAKRPDDSEKLEKARYKYLFKKPKVSEEVQNETDSEAIIEQLNSSF